MSFDLLKEFGEIQENPWESERTHRHDLTNDDDFGEFERPEAQAAPEYQHRVVPHQLSFSQIRDGAVPLQIDEEDDFEEDDAEQTINTEESGLDWDWQAPQARKNENDVLNDNFGSSVLFDADIDTASRKTRPSTPEHRKRMELLAVEVDEDDFAAWDPVDAAEPHPTTEALQPEIARPGFNQTSQASTVRGPEVGPPPSNVPPPSLLLSMSNVILGRFESRLKKSTKGADGDNGMAEMEEILSDLAAIGRILAGRKSRWNRDTFLSQSMRIGQAGTQGGMKLTKVDKTESRREDQEALELLKTWRQHAGALRSRLARAATKQMPELVTNMPVRVAKAGEGALIAPKACFLCGLKRDERVMKIDFGVEDGFGLWWIEHWGHCDCVNFWDKYKKDLPQR